jgi:hypothetical protein
MRGTLFEKVLLILVVLCAVSLPARAELITIALTGQVDSVSDTGDLLGGAVHPGDVISGYYCYDTVPSESSGSSTSVSYNFLYPKSGMQLTVGGLSFENAPSTPGLNIFMEDNFCEQDSIRVTPRSVISPLSGIQDVTMNWMLSGPITQITSTNLITTAPDLSGWTMNSLAIGGDTQDYMYFLAINGHVTSTVLVPEPITLFLIGFGFLITRGRRS